MKIEIEELKHLTLSIAITPFHVTLLGDTETIVGMVLMKMLQRIPLEQRHNMSLTEMNLNEVIKEIHEPATFIKLKDWNYVLNFTGMPISEEIKQRFNN